MSANDGSTGVSERFKELDEMLIEDHPEVIEIHSRVLVSSERDAEELREAVQGAVVDALSSLPSITEAEVTENPLHTESDRQEVTQ